MSKREGKLRELPAVSVFHHLPSGGGIGALSRNLSILGHRYRFRAHVPERGASFDPDPGIEVSGYPFPQGRRLTGLRRALAPLALMARLRSFDRLCERIAERIENDGSRVALVHNSMIIAAPPLLQHLSVPGIYVCYEYPRHIYEPDLVSRAGTAGRIFLAGVRAMERRVDMDSCQASSAVVAISTYMSTRLKQVYGLESQPGVARPGVDTAFFDPSSAAASLSAEGAGYVLSVGALWPFKGHDSIIRSISRLPESVRVPLRIVADRELPGYSRSLLRLADDLDVHLSISMNVPRSELRSLYLGASAVACAQRREPYGLVPLEAMSCGRAVVAFREGGFVENIRHEETGLLVDPSPEGLSWGLDLLLGDRDLRRELGQRGRRFVLEERTQEKGAGDLASLMDPFLSGRSE